MSEGDFVGSSAVAAGNKKTSVAEMQPSFYADEKYKNDLHADHDFNL